MTHSAGPLCWHQDFPNVCYVSLSERGFGLLASRSQGSPLKPQNLSLQDRGPHQLDWFQLKILWISTEILLKFLQNILCFDQGRLILAGDQLSGMQRNDARADLGFAGTRNCNWVLSRVKREGDLWVEWL